MIGDYDSSLTIESAVFASEFDKRDYHTSQMIHMHIMLELRDVRAADLFLPHGSIPAEKEAESIKSYINWVDPRSGKNAVIIAALTGDEDILKWALDRGGDANFFYRDKTLLCFLLEWKYNEIKYSMKHPYSRVITRLLEAGADPLIKIPISDNPILWILSGSGLSTI